MTTYPLVDWEVDIAGKYRFRIDIDGQTVMFKYEEYPTDEQLQADAAMYVEMNTLPANGA